MKILFLTPRDSGKNLGGVEGHVRLLTEELERRGSEVKELSLEETDKSYKDYKNYKDQDNTSIASLDSSTRRRLLARNDRFFKFRAWMYLWQKRDLFRWAEVVHVHDVFWWLLPYVLLNRLGLLGGSFNLLNKVAKRDTNDTNRHANDTNKGKIYTTFHGWEGVYPPTRSAVWQKRLAQKLSRGTIGVGSFFKKWYGVEPDRVVWGVVAPVVRSPLPSTTLSVGTRRGVPSTTWGTGHSATTGFGRTSRFFQRKNPGPSEIAFLGRLEEVNGIEVVIEAFRKLEHIKARPFRERPGLFRYIFVGDGSYRKQAVKFGKVTGMVKNPEKYLVDADLVITSSYMSMLEAAGMGKPIIAIANSSLKEDYLRMHPLGKWMKIFRNSEELIEEIRELYKGLAFDYKGQALGTGEAMSWARRQTPGKLADVYEEVWKMDGN